MSEKNKNQDKQTQEKGKDTIHVSEGRLIAGMTCPRCHRAKLAYNGLLQLTCPECGLTEAGACT